MIKKIEAFLLEKFAGKLLARAAVTIAAFVAGPVVQGVAAKYGVDIKIDPKELEAGLVLGAHAAFEAYKAWRQKKDAAPAAPEAAKS